jgi:hypothetical protein
MTTSCEHQQLVEILQQLYRSPLFENDTCPFGSADPALN